jgi:hypothetical protein
MDAGVGDLLSSGHYDLGILNLGNPHPEINAPDKEYITLGNTRRFEENLFQTISGRKYLIFKGKFIPVIGRGSP